MLYSFHRKLIVYLNIENIGKLVTIIPECASKLWYCTYLDQDRHQRERSWRKWGCRPWPIRKAGDSTGTCFHWWQTTWAAASASAATSSRCACHQNVQRNQSPDQIYENSSIHKFDISNNFNSFIHLFSIYTAVRYDNSDRKVHASVRDSGELWEVVSCTVALQRTYSEK